MVLDDTDSTSVGHDEDDVAVQKLLQNAPKIGQVFTILHKIGEGTFSEVYAARLRNRPDVAELFALKHIVPTSHPSRIEREIHCLKDIGGVANVMGLFCCIRNRDHVVIVMPYFRHDRFQNYLWCMSIAEVRDYMHGLLTALRHVHSFDVCHRDVKPSNFLYDRRQRRFMLVDFGLAHKVDSSLLDLTTISASYGSCVTDGNTDCTQTSKTARIHPNSESSLPMGSRSLKSPRKRLLSKSSVFIDGRAHRRTHSAKVGQKWKTRNCSCYGTGSVCNVCLSRPAQNAPRAGTPGYRAPEVLMKSSLQTTAMDMWAAGVILLSLLSKRYPFFKGPDDMTSLAQIIKILGSESVRNGAATFNKLLLCDPECPPMNLKTLCVCLRTGCEATTRDFDSELRTLQDNQSSSHSEPGTRQNNPSSSHSEPGTRQNNPSSSHSEPGTRLPSSSQSFMVPDSAFHLLERLLDPSPLSRISATQALELTFFTGSLE